MDLTDKTVLVTGAAKRIGSAIARRLASLGAHVAVHYCSSKAQADETVDAIRQLGREALSIQGDLSVREEAVRVADEALQWRGELAVLVNNAATFPRAVFGETMEKDWEDPLSTNLLAPFWLSQAIAPHFAEAGAGKIINITDISSQSPWTTRLPYCASKAALVSLTIGLAKELAPQVQVNAISPGPVLFPDDYTKKQHLDVIERTLLKRAGSPEDVADAVDFFCRSDFVTGVVLPVDGGQSLPGS